MKSQAEVGDAVWLDQTLSDALPNVTFSWDGEPGAPAYGAVIDGHVREIVEGAGYRDSIDDNDAQHREVLPFDSTEANWRMVVLTVEVVDDFGASTELPSVIEIGVRLDGTTDPEMVRKGFEGQHVFAVLNAPGLLEPKEAYTVARNGALIGVVLDDGSVSLPGLGVEEGSYVDVLTTLKAIEAAAQTPPVVISITTENGFPEREA